jgi:hypothetical protein
MWMDVQRLGNGNTSQRLISETLHARTFKIVWRIEKSGRRRVAALLLARDSPR